MTKDCEAEAGNYHRHGLVPKILLLCRRLLQPKNLSSSSPSPTNSTPPGANWADEALAATAAGGAAQFYLGSEAAPLARDRDCPWSKLKKISSLEFSAFYFITDGMGEVTPTPARELIDRAIGENRPIEILICMLLAFLFLLALTVVAWTVIAKKDIPPTGVGAFVAACGAPVLYLWRIRNQNLALRLLETTLTGSDAGEIIKGFFSTSFKMRICPQCKKLQSGKPSP